MIGVSAASGPIPWADPTGPTRNVTHLLDRDGTSRRCAVVVNASPRETLGPSDYESHHKFLPYVTKLEATRKDDGAFSSTALQSSVWGDYPKSGDASRERCGRTYLRRGRRRRMMCSSSTAQLASEAGGQDAKKTLDLQLAIELAKYPNFIVAM